MASELLGILRRKNNVARTCPPKDIPLPMWHGLQPVSFAAGGPFRSTPRGCLPTGAGDSRLGLKSEPHLFWSMLHGVFEVRSLSDEW